MFKLCVNKLSLLLIFLSSHAYSLTTVTHVDLNRYLGTWYEIARIDSWFERGCTNTTAHYQLNANNSINITNTCLKNNTLKHAYGRAKIVEPTSNAKLKVSFLPRALSFLDFIFSGDYWIIAIDPNYKNALIGTPDHKYLWIISRTPKLPQEIYENYLKIAQEQGFDLTKIIKL